jgi:hypothetical protein
MEEIPKNVLQDLVEERNEKTVTSANKHHGNLPTTIFIFGPTGCTATWMRQAIN